MFGTAEPRNPRQAKSRPRLHTQKFRRPVLRRTDPQKVATEHAPYRPPTAQQNSGERSNKHAQTERKTTSKGRTNTTSTDLWRRSRPNTTTKAGRTAATPSLPNRALHQRRRITKHKKGKNGGLKIPQRWTQPPEPLVLPKNILWMPRNSQASTPTTDYTTATLIYTHNAPRAKVQLWKVWPGNNQFQKKYTYTRTDKTTNTTTIDRNDYQVQLRSKYKEARSRTINQHTLPQQTPAQPPPHQLCYYLPLSPHFHPQFESTPVLESTSIELQASPSQYKQPASLHLHQTSPPHLQQLALPSLKQISTNTRVDRERYRIALGKLEAECRNRSKQSMQPRNTTNGGTTEHSKKASRGRTSSRKASKARTSNWTRPSSSGGDPGNNWTWPSRSRGDLGSSSDRSRGATTQANRCSNNSPPQRPLATVTDTSQPGSTITITSTSHLTSSTNAYYVSNVQCITPKQSEGRGPVSVCVSNCIVSLGNSVDKLNACSRYKNSSKSINYNKKTKKSLYDRKMKHKSLYALAVYPITYLHNVIICTVVSIRNILELKYLNTKLPFLKVMLHPAPQITLWGGVDLENTRENHLLKNTLHNLKKTFSKKIRMPHSQIHKIVSQKNSNSNHKCMRSCKNNRNSQNNSIQRISLQTRNKKQRTVLALPFRKNKQNLPSFSPKYLCKNTIIRLIPETKYKTVREQTLSKYKQNLPSQNRINLYKKKPIHSLGPLNIYEKQTVLKQTLSKYKQNLSSHSQTKVCKNSIHRLGPEVSHKKLTVLTQTPNMKKQNLSFYNRRKLCNNHIHSPGPLKIYKHKTVLIQPLSKNKRNLSCHSRINKCKNYTYRLGPELIYKKTVLIQTLKKYKQNLPSHTYAREYSKHSPPFSYVIDTPRNKIITPSVKITHYLVPLRKLRVISTL